MKKLIIKTKEKFIGILGSITGITSILGSWQVCHSVCLGIIAILSIIGITIVGMPLLFLTKVAIPFWIAAAVLLSISIGIYLKKRCISNKLIVFNTGLVIIAIPFQPFQKFSAVLWLIGGIFIILSLILTIKSRK